MNTKKMLLIKNKNSGFSLVELLISIAILAVVSLGVVMFMTTSSNSYSRTSAELDLQTEAQMVANSLTDLIIDCEKRVNDTEQTVVGFDFNGDGNTTGKKFTTGHVIEICNSKTQYLIVWNDTTQRIYYVEKQYNETTKSWPASYDGSTCQLLAENVSNFELDLSRFVKDRIVAFSMTYSIRGKHYTGNYQVHLRNDVEYNTGNIYTPDNVATIKGIDITPNPATVIKGQTTSIQFVSDMKIDGTGTFNPKVKWEIIGTNTGCSIDDKTGLLTATGPYTMKEFKVKATSEENATIAGFATVNVKKVEAITPVNTGGLTTKNEDGLPSVVKFGTVTYIPEVTGWNLNSEDGLATWKLEYKSSSGDSYKTICEYNTSTKSYQNTDAGIAVLAPVSSGVSIKVGQNAGTTYEFRLTAISKTDNTISGSTEFGVSTVKREFTGAVVRGAYINLNDYFLAKKVEGVTATEILSIELTQATNLDEKTKTFIYCKDGIMFWDYGAFKYASAQSLNFFDYQNLQFTVTYRDETGQIRTQTGVNFPFEAAVITSTPTPGNIVMTKGSIKNFSLGFKGVNITNKSFIGIYAYTDDLNVAGNENLNPYITASMTSAVGTAYSPVTKASVRLSTNTNTKMYPTEGIPFTIALKSIYEPSNGSRPNSYQAFKIYIANVEGANIFIPGYDSPDVDTVSVFKPANTNINTPTKSKVDIFYQQYVMGPGLTTVEIRKKDLDPNIQIWYMKYNNNLYEFDNTYKYWKRIVNEPARVSNVEGQNIIIPGLGSTATNALETFGYLNPSQTYTNIMTSTNQPILKYTDYKMGPEFTTVKIRKVDVDANTTNWYMRYDNKTYLYDKISGLWKQVFKPNVEGLSIYIAGIDDPARDTIKYFGYLNSSISITPLNTPPTSNYRTYKMGSDLGLIDVKIKVVSGKWVMNYNNVVYTYDTNTGAWKK